MVVVSSPPVTAFALYVLLACLILHCSSLRWGFWARPVFLCLRSLVCPELLPDEAQKRPVSCSLLSEKCFILRLHWCLLVLLPARRLSWIVVIRVLDWLLGRFGRVHYLSFAGSEAHVLSCCLLQAQRFAMNVRCFNCSIQVLYPLGWIHPFLVFPLLCLFDCLDRFMFVEVNVIQLLWSEG